MTHSRPLLTVIVPTYNESDTITKVLDDLLKLKLDYLEMEIIVVDDGSLDETFEQVKKFSSIRLFRHEKNMGKGMAVKTGTKNALGKILVIQDADLEYSPNFIPSLIKPILKGQARVVYGSRLMGKCDGMSVSHYLGNVILSKITSLLYNVKITDVMTGHKAFLREIFRSIDLTERGFTVEVELTSKILQAGWKIVEVPVEYSRRKYGSSKISYLDGIRSLLHLLINKMAS